MNVAQEMVYEFHRKFEFTRNLVPTLIDTELGLIRHKHTLEEMEELRQAIESQNMIAIADALCDVLYFIIGTGVAYGIPLEAIFAEVHRSNMTKERPLGGGDAKAVKGKDYSPPDIASIIKHKLRSEK